MARAADDLGLRGELVFVGLGHAERLRAELGGLISIVSVGHVEEAKAAAVLRGTFLQYLSYPFGWRDRVLRQTSFPSKLATYIAAGRPLLLHTSADSTTAELATIPGLCYHWDDLNVEHGVQLLKKAWADPATSLGAHGALEEVRRRYYDPDTIKTNLMGMLDAMVGPLTEESQPSPRPISTSIQTAGVSSTPSTLSADLRSPNLFPSCISRQYPVIGRRSADGLGPVVDRGATDTNGAAKLLRLVEVGREATAQADVTGRRSGVDNRVAIGTGTGSLALSGTRVATEFTDREVTRVPRPLRAVRAISGNETHPEVAPGAPRSFPARDV